MMRTISPKSRIAGGTSLRKSPGYWDNIGNQRKELIAVGKKLGYKKMEDWYQISVKKLRHQNLGGLLLKYKGSPSNLLQTIFPEHHFDIRKFSTVPNGYWGDINNQRAAIKQFGKEMGYKRMEDWYQTSAKKLEHRNLGGLLAKYNGSPSNLLQTIFPEHHFDTRKFSSVPTGYWDDINNQREATKKLGKELGYKSMEDWYQITQNDLYRQNLGGLLTKYNGSPSQFVKAMFPEHQFYPWKFSSIPKGCWEDKENRIAYMKWLMQELNMKKVDDLYSITVDTLQKNHGLGLYSHFHNSKTRLLEDFFDNRQDKKQLQKSSNNIPLPKKKSSTVQSASSLHVKDSNQEEEEKSDQDDDVIDQLLVIIEKMDENIIELEKGDDRLDQLLTVIEKMDERIIQLERRQ
eukprot:TRINITY_DN3656_c0_g1_i6.p1 TRINITY_DN3656_c0_g1~~TRINITY_DN3656_c0_g1_i6.p1  ORF type:complete len:404 (+),score=92.95 TRINITY_DN3656_c0_g1_i6:77-1288(+)